MNDRGVTESIAALPWIRGDLDPVFPSPFDPRSAADFFVIPAVPKKNQDMAATSDEISNFRVLPGAMLASGIENNGLPIRIGHREQASKFSKRLSGGKVSLVFQLFHWQRH